MQLENKVLFALMLLVVQLAHSQETNPGIWASAGIQKKIKKWELNLTTEVRSVQYVDHLKKLGIETEAAYNFNKFLKAGASYQLIDHYDQEYNDYQLRQRISGFISGKQKLGPLTVTLKEKIQFTTKNDSDRVMSDGEIDNYLVSPEWMWRNQLKLLYNIPHFPVSPAFALESFYLLNNPEGNSFNKLRYTLSFGYRLSKHHELELSGIIQNPLNSTTKVNSAAVGIGYTYKF